MKTLLLLLLFTVSAAAQSVWPGPEDLTVNHPLKLYTYGCSGTVSSGGNAIIYLTSDGTESGHALYTSINAVMPMVNDSESGYSYSWTLSQNKKVLTVNVKKSVGVSVLGISVMALPANAPNGTGINLIVIGK